VAHTVSTPTLLFLRFLILNTASVEQEFIFFFCFRFYGSDVLACCNWESASESIVAYRLITKRWLCKQKPLLGNASNNKRAVFSVVRVATVKDASTRIDKMFSTLSVPKGYKDDNWGNQIGSVRSEEKLHWQLQECSVESRAVKRRLYVWFWSVKFSETVIVPVLKSVARKRLLETVTDWGH
jgi:hypothetical protein